MGFPWDKKDDSKAAAKPADKPAESSVSKAAGDAPKIGPPDQKADALPAPSSLFEFGPTVAVGTEIMRGTCTGDDPDAILACTWHLEPAQGKPRDKVHSYRIEF